MQPSKQQGLQLRKNDGEENEAERNARRSPLRIYRLARCPKLVTRNIFNYLMHIVLKDMRTYGMQVHSNGHKYAGNVRVFHRQNESLYAYPTRTKYKLN